jgi:hypothetical protein
MGNIDSKRGRNRTIDSRSGSPASIVAHCRFHSELFSSLFSLPESECRGCSLVILPQVLAEQCRALGQARQA